MESSGGQAKLSISWSCPQKRGERWLTLRTGGHKLAGEMGAALFKGHEPSRPQFPHLLNGNSSCAPWTVGEGPEERAPRRLHKGHSLSSSFHGDRVLKRHFLSPQ